MTETTPNKRTVEAYMDAYSRTARAEILDCLTDDVRWDIAGAFHTHGKPEFDAHIVDPYSAGNPEITITRLTEENDVVIAEGTVRAARLDGTVLTLDYCDVFEMRDGKVARLISYLMTTHDASEPTG